MFRRARGLTRMFWRLERVGEIITSSAHPFSSCLRRGRLVPNLARSIMSDAPDTLTLILSEAVLRRQKGETIDVEEYCRRFPELAPLIRRRLPQALAQADFASPPAVVSDQPPAAALQVGPYQLLEQLGQGGMGQVFKARHGRLGKLVALKLIHPGRLDHPDARR